MRAFAPDAIVVVAYGQILNDEILSMPELGCFNVHASLLPRFRGAAPMQHAILSGEEKTGITIMRSGARSWCSPASTRRTCTSSARPIGGCGTCAPTWSRPATAARPGRCRPPAALMTEYFPLPLR